MNGFTAHLVPGNTGDTNAEMDLKLPLFKLRIANQQFHRQPDPAIQKELFSSSVKRVAIETSSYCNRRCVFCPNADGSRLGTRKLMPDEMFNAIIDDLAQIGYSNAILFHLYNEPLANPNIFFQIAYARLKLPKAALSFNTNGDYIKADTLQKLVSAGLTSLHVSIYGPGHGTFKKDYVFNKVQDMVTTCTLTGTEPEWISEVECRAKGVFKHGDLTLLITIQARDFNQNGYDRGGLVDFSEQVLPDRQYPCPSPFDEVLITWNGVAVPCCNVDGDRPEHQQFNVGRVTGAGSIFSIYANGPLVEWRRNLVRFQKHKAPCTKCTRLSKSIPSATPEHLAFNAAVDEFINSDAG